MEPIQLPRPMRRTRCIHILYATQTGNSRSLAYRLQNHLVRNRFKVKTSSLQHYSGYLLSQHSEFDQEEEQEKEEEEEGQGGDRVDDKSQSQPQPQLPSSSSSSSSSIPNPLPPIFIFLISTTGVGDFPSSSIQFWNSLLRSDLPKDTFDNLTFLTFALGDSSYERFCWPARKLNARLRHLGAKELDGMTQVEADERHYLGLDGTFLPWMSSLTDRLNLLDPLPSQEDVIPEDALLPPQIDVQFVSDPSNSSGSNPNTDTRTNTNGITSSSPILNGHSTKPPIPSKGGWKEGRLFSNKRMTSNDHYQDVRLIEIERNDGEEIQYRPGDIAMLLPSNSKEHVDRLLKALGWENEAEKLITIKRNSRSSDHFNDDADAAGEDEDEDEEIDSDLIPTHSPTSPTTLRNLLTYNLSPLSIPDLSFFLTLYQFSPPHLSASTLPPNPTSKGYDPNDGESLERSKLKEFVTPGEGQDECSEYAGRVRRTKLEVLEEFSATAKRITIRFCVELLGWMGEREFSIASGAKIYPNKIQLSIALVKYKTRLKEPRKGICSRWLENLEAGTTFPFKITSGTLSSLAPPLLNQPLVLIGPGTGVAPMRSFIHDRLFQARQQADQPGPIHRNLPVPVPNTTLFCGCRYRKKDFLFGSEWKNLSLSSSEHSFTSMQEEEEAEEKEGMGKIDFQTDPTITSPFDSFFSFHLAPSRDSEEKIYVQDLMRRQEQSRLLWNIVGKLGGSVFVSGSSGPMPKAVRKALEQACIDHGEMDQDQASRFLLKLEKEGRWREECWT